MARGESGRIVLEIDPSHKDEIYTALTKDGFTLKDWFLKQAAQYLRDRSQMSLFGASVISEELSPFKVKPAPAMPAAIKPKTIQNRTKSK